MTKKINLYVFIQIFKSCTLVFFIFISISWLLQISRLFNFLSNFQVKFIDTFFLSFFLIPNLIYITLPFIIIFGFAISFIKLDKDKEIIAFFTLGIPITEIKKPIFFFIFITSIIYLFLNLFLSPYIYESYKQKEFELRSSIDLNKINISNFIEINENVILDFNKENNKFKDVFINYKEKNENIIYAKTAYISNNNNELVFNLENGFKIEFIEKKIEKLEFENYKFNIQVNKNLSYNNTDNNTLTVINLINKKNYFLILEKIFEALILITIIVFFYYNNILVNKFNLKEIFIFILLSILILIIHNLIKNIDIHNSLALILSIFNLSLLYLYMLFKRTLSA